MTDTMIQEAPAPDLSEGVSASGKASHQWWSRPADQRYTSLTDMLDHFRDRDARSFARVQPGKKLWAAPVDGILLDNGKPDRKVLAILDEHERPMQPTHFSFGQLCTRVEAPAAYLRKLPAALAADNLNYGFLTKDADEVGLYGLMPKAGDPPGDELMAATGPRYGRVRNSALLEAVIDRFGDGVTGDFRVPGEFGKELTEITKANTSLFAGDRDMFIFLTDEKNKIEIPNRRNGEPGLLSRGFYVWNSEVGSTTLGIATFLFDFICRNRTVWGMEDWKEIKIKHTSGAPQRFIDEVRPAVLAYAQSSTADLVGTIRAAQEAKIEQDLDDFLVNRRFSRTQAKAIQAVHVAEEGRPIETIWDASTAITAYARSIEYQDERVLIEREGGKVLKLAA